MLAAWWLCLLPVLFRPDPGELGVSGEVELWSVVDGEIDVTGTVQRVGHDIWEVTPARGAPQRFRLELPTGLVVPFHDGDTIHVELLALMEGMTAFVTGRITDARGELLLVRKDSPDAEVDGWSTLPGPVVDVQRVRYERGRIVTTTRAASVTHQGRTTVTRNPWAWRVIDGYAVSAGGTTIDYLGTKGPLDAGHGRSHLYLVRLP